MKINYKSLVYPPYKSNLWEFQAGYLTEDDETCRKDSAAWNKHDLVKEYKYFKSKGFQVDMATVYKPSDSYQYRGALIDEVIGTGNPLHRAVTDNCPSLVEYMLSSEYGPNKTTSNGYTALDIFHAKKTISPRIARGVQLSLFLFASVFLTICGTARELKFKSYKSTRPLVLVNIIEGPRYDIYELTFSPDR